MAVGTTMALIMMGAGLGISAYGQKKAGDAAKKQGVAQRESAEAQADLADFNADVAKLQADDAIRRGAEDANAYRAQIRQTIGSQRAAAAGGNIDVLYGSPVDVERDARRLGELDMLTIRTNAAREAWGYEVEAVDSRRRAEIARKEGVYLEKAGRSAATAAYLGAASTVIGGAGNLMMTKYGYERNTLRA